MRVSSNGVKTSSEIVIATDLTDRKVGILQPLGTKIMAVDSIDNSGVLLTTADRQIENFTAETGDPNHSFEDSFYEAILFHDHAVLPDIFAFISTAIGNSSGSKNHLDLALEAGFVVPAFRGNARCFEESLALITEQGIQGVQKLKAPRVLAARLDEGFKKATKRSFVPWPTDLSQKYGDLVLECLTAVERAAEDIAAWGPTAKFLREHRLVESIKADIETRRVEHKTERGELLRGNFYNILLAILDDLNGKPTVTKVNDCYKDLLLHPVCKSRPNIQEPILDLLGIANFAYQLNMATACHAGSYIPGRLIDEKFKRSLELVESIAKAKEVSDVQAETASVDRRLEVEVSIPTIQQLRNASWEEILKIRADIGYEYFIALKGWNRDEEYFKKCLNAYAKKLTQTVNETAPRTRVVLQSFIGRNLATAFETIKGYLPEEVALIASMGQVGLNTTMLFSQERPVNLRFDPPRYPSMVV
jgi:hypothetical protein